MSSNTNNSNYNFNTNNNRLSIPNELWTEIQSRSFSSLVKHLQERSDLVQNMELMTIAGFCRNCLAKWIVVSAHTIADELRQYPSSSNIQRNSSSHCYSKDVIAVLDSLSYDDAAFEVYDCAYKEWKERHMKKASDEQMQRFQDSSKIHAKHDKDLLKPRIQKEEVNVICLRKLSDGNGLVNASTALPSSNLMSNVCCEDVSQMKTHDSKKELKGDQSTTSSSYEPPSPPSNLVDLQVGILTISDRAALGKYATGDLSGPAVEHSFLATIQQLQDKYHMKLACDIVRKTIVPDETNDIATTLRSWSRKEEDSVESQVSCNLIFTTGGTGFSSRDVTPEATRSVLERECKSLMLWTINECSKNQPMASLSRGTAGICGKALIINLPGNPAGAADMVRLMTPLVLHAVNDL